MSSEKEITMFQKSTAYDLLNLFDEQKKDTFTIEEIHATVKAYIKGQES